MSLDNDSDFDLKASEDEFKKRENKEINFLI